jgi:exopolyphosphatase / guanosine-5'-triphosphate,3'-diphosphate pyrophosphatase
MSLKLKRFAAIDIGTNSIRCIVVEVKTNGKFKVLDDEKATVRLGEGLYRTGELTPDSWQRALEALTRMKKVVDGYCVSAIDAVATSAVRQAANGREFIDEIDRKVGIIVEVISGEEEAELAVLSARNNFDMEGVPHVMVDIGGGSVEIITAFGSHLEELVSLQLGAVVLTERFLKSDPVAPGEVKLLRKHIRTVLNERFQDGFPAHCLLGSGGTMNAIAAMTMAMGKESYNSIHGYDILRSQVVHLLAMLLRKDLKELRSVPGLNADRCDIIITGVTVVDELMRFFEANILKINERGVREGLVLRGLRRHGFVPMEEKPRNWRDSILEFARSCHFDEEHSLHVTRLALLVFDHLSDSFGLSGRDRQMLEAAALLHDVGYLISYDGHHKHTYLLIRHADLFGFTPREREIIATIARYHRKALPKMKHEVYARLGTPDRLLVRQLGGILRLCDGLDRRRNSQISTLECTLTPSTCTLKVLDSVDVSVELFGAKAKGDLFEIAFGRKLLLTSV